MKADLEECYVGVYASDDMNSKKSCETTLIFGEPKPKSYVPSRFDWKWVTLPCPHCGISHNFKRMYWFTDKDLSWK